MLDDINPFLAVWSLIGLVAGLGLLVRGMQSYRTASLISDTSTSTISALAVGEVRVTGVIETAELALMSPLQSARCVWYRSKLREQRGRDSTVTVLDEEHGVGFRVRDPGGSVRVFPRGATFDVPSAFKARSGFAGEQPPGLRMRTGPEIDLAEPSREAQIAALLTVHQPVDEATPGLTSGHWGRGVAEYEEARLEPGETVTIVGRVLPFSDLPDPTGADSSFGEADPATGGDPEIAADLARARAAGLLADDPAEAWGNAAIPGFGIGRPVAPPELDPAATRPDLATVEQAAQASRIFDIPPDTLVLAAAEGSPLLISAGSPSIAADRQEQRFVVGLLGAALSIVSAVMLAAVVQGLGR